jgi:hypothetical protein
LDTEIEMVSDIDIEAQSEAINVAPDFESIRANREQAAANENCWGSLIEPSE